MPAAVSVGEGRQAQRRCIAVPFDPSAVVKSVRELISWQAGIREAVLGSPYWGRKPRPMNAQDRAGLELITVQLRDLGDAVESWLTTDAPSGKPQSAGRLLHSSLNNLLLTSYEVSHGYRKETELEPLLLTLKRQANEIIGQCQKFRGTSAVREAPAQGSSDLNPLREASAPRGYWIEPKVIRITTLSAGPDASAQVIRDHGLPAKEFAATRNGPLDRVAALFVAARQAIFHFLDHDQSQRKIKG